MTKPVSFEQSIHDLETIVQHLERGDLALDDALQQFEKGIQLTRNCQTMLTAAEQKIASLTIPATQGPETDE